MEIEEGNFHYVSVSSIDRLGRILFDILTTLEILKERKAILKDNNLGIESLVEEKENAAFKLTISVMANTTEMERQTILERQREGIALAKAGFTKVGKRDQWNLMKNFWQNTKMLLSL